jgi:hypothetical protein
MLGVSETSAIRNAFQHNIAVLGEFVPEVMGFIATEVLFNAVACMVISIADSTIIVADELVTAVVSIASSANLFN